MVAGALAAGILLLHRRVGLVAMMAAFLLAFSRVYVGVHYPSDVVVGLLLGFAVTATLMIPFCAIIQPLLAKIARTPLRPALTTAR
jgi:undecaprenyl-diphosphatase